MTVGHGGWATTKLFFQVSCLVLVGYRVIDPMCLRRNALARQFSTRLEITKTLRTIPYNALLTHRIPHKRVGVTTRPLPQREPSLRRRLFHRLSHGTREAPGNSQKRSILPSSILPCARHNVLVSDFNAKKRLKHLANIVQTQYFLRTHWT